MAMCLNDDRFSGPITIAEYMREVLTNPIQVKACALYMLSNQQIPIIVVVLQRYRTGRFLNSTLLLYSKMMFFALNYLDHNNVYFYGTVNYT